MCGVAGLVLGEGEGPVDEPLLEAMTNSLSSRGPDGAGFFRDGNVGLGHRRLAIIDVEGGAQPLFSEDRHVVVVINGELYNFKSLRTQLKKKGHHFATLSDSEVLVHGYEEWGDRVLDRLEGMFAFALWDGRQRRLLLARDRLGEKPLYWARLPRGGLAFASELRALCRCPSVDTSIDPRSLAQYLVYEYTPGPATIIAGARKLEPGMALSFRVGEEPTSWIYWDLPLPSVKDGRNRYVVAPRKAADWLLAELRRSVHQRLVSDVPLGVFLSGGLDSSAVAALAAEVRGGDLDSFSIGFEDPTFDESEQAQLVARTLGIRHHQERLSARFVLDTISSIGELLDEPLGDGSFVPTYLLSRFARQHVTVALGGDGGDDLFAGYPTFQAEKSALWLSRSPCLEKATLFAARNIAAMMPVSQRYMALDFKIKQFLRGISESGPSRHQSWLGSLLPAEALSALRPEVAQIAGNNLHTPIEDRLIRCQSANPWDRLLYYYVKAYLGEGILTKVDRASMSVGLEVRSPFLSRGVVDVACRCAPSLRLRGLTTKYVLKRAVEELLPRRIINRPKKGFGMPIGRWLRGELRSLVETELGDSELRRGGVFEPSFVRRMVREHVEGEVDHRKPLWTLLTFQSWYRSWLAR